MLIPLSRDCIYSSVPSSRPIGTVAFGMGDGMVVVHLYSCYLAGR